jgi:hypothetical protein
LTTNRRPSATAHLPGSNDHFAAFIHEVWQSARNHREGEPWQPLQSFSEAWTVLQQTSGLNGSEFLTFVQDCEFEFGYELPGADASLTVDSQIFVQDLQQLTDSLLAAVSDPSHIVELKRDDLLARVGWSERVEFRSRHEFPIDDQRYEPIASTATEFNAALNSTSRGYLGVLGSPGSGKSSLLTHSLRLRPERVIRYYAYVPDAQDPLRSRGEAANFLHDLVLAIEQAGFSAGRSLSRFEPAQLRIRLHKQFELLHRDWETTRRKTIIAIDGLDHIAREVQPLPPTRSAASGAGSRGCPHRSW